MTTEKDIQEQIRKDIDAHSNSVYDGSLPDSFREGFKQSLMFIAPANHRYNMGFIKTLVSKKADEVTVMEVGIMINLIFSTPWYLIYKNVEEGIDTTIEYEKVKDEYNAKSTEFERKISLKKRKLMEIAGLGEGKTVPFNSGIIANA